MSCYKNLDNQIRSLYQYEEWRYNVMRRDNYYCQHCGKKVRLKSVMIFPKLPLLNTHHIKGFKQIIKENNITNVKEALMCDELWDKNNGLTLCVRCHKKTDSFGKNK